MNVGGFKRFLAMCGLLPRPEANTAITTAGAGTLTAAALVGGVITRSGPTTAFTDTTTTATLLAQRMTAPATIGQSWVVKYRNTTAFAATIAGGTGVTVSGTSNVPGFSTSEFLITYTAAATFTMVGLGANGKVPVETVAATRVLTAEESGAVIVLSHATEFATTLPAVAAGLRFTFIVGAAPSGASYTVAAASGTPIHGHVVSVDLNGATDSASTAGTGVLTLTFVNGKSQKGDRADFVCDGTDWFVQATTGGAFDSITLS